VTTPPVPGTPSSSSRTAQPGGHPAQQAAPADARGAVDLSALGGAPAGGPGAAGPVSGAEAAPIGRWSTELDEASFQDLVQLSTRVPVVIAVSNERVQGGAELRASLVSAIDAEQGRVVLGLVDPDAQPRIAQALQVQQIPAVFAVLGGRPMPLFVGPVDGAQISALLQELLGVAVQQGMAGTVPPFSHPEGAAQPPARFPEADELVAAGDYEGAAAIYEAALSQNPGDDEAAVGLHRARLLGRVASADAARVRQAAASAPDDVAAQIDVADLDVVGGHVEDAFRRLVGFIGTHFGDERESARAHLVELFGVVGQQDPRVVAARGRLAAALF